MISPLESYVLATHEKGLLERPYRPLLPAAYMVTFDSALLLVIMQMMEDRHAKTAN